MFSFTWTSDQQQWHGQLTLSNTEQHDGSWMSTAKHPASTPSWTLQNGQHYNNLAKKPSRCSTNSAMVMSLWTSASYQNHPADCTRGRRTAAITTLPAEHNAIFPKTIPVKNGAQGGRHSGLFQARVHLPPSLTWKKTTDITPIIYLPSLLPPTQFPSKPPHIGHNVRIFNLLKMDIYLMEEEEIRKTTG